MVAKRSWWAEQVQQNCGRASARGCPPQSRPLVASPLLSERGLQQQPTFSRGLERSGFTETQVIPIRPRCSVGEVTQATPKLPDGFCFNAFGNQVRQRPTRSGADSTDQDEPGRQSWGVRSPRLGASGLRAGAPRACPNQSPPSGSVGLLTLSPIAHVRPNQAAESQKRPQLSLARGMGPPDCQGDGTTVARY